MASLSTIGSWAFPESSRILRHSQKRATALPLRSVLFVTVHKGASTFISDELGRFLVTGQHYEEFRPVGAMRIRGTEIREHSEWPATGLVGVRIYPAEMRDLLSEAPGFAKFVEDAALVFIQRDPRDAAVSLFYSKAYSHTTRVLNKERFVEERERLQTCLLYTSPSPRDQRGSRMPSSA